MALSLKLFGISEIALRIPSILLSTTISGLPTPSPGITPMKDGAAGGLSARHPRYQIIALTAGRAAKPTTRPFIFFSSSWGVLPHPLSQRAALVYECADRYQSIGLGVLTKWLPAFIVAPV